LTTQNLNTFGIFNPNSVEKLLSRIRTKETVTENENMAIAGILSTQILMDLFLNENNPFKATEMRIKCPVTYDKSIKTKL